jgi:hypothetical protein
MIRAVQRARDEYDPRERIGDIQGVALRCAAARLELIKPQLYLDCDGVLADFDKKAREVFGGNPRAWENEYAADVCAELIAHMPPDSPALSGEEGQRLKDHCDKLASEAFWEKLYAVDNLFEELDVMPGANELVEAVQHLNPIILTGCPRGYWAVPQKLRWRDKHFPDLPMICVESINKRAHCRPGDVLVDDWAKYQRHWEDEGGVFVLHESVGATLSRLKELGLL